MEEMLPRWREETPGCANRVHLNNASAALMPQCVLRAVTGHLEREANFGGYDSADAAAEAVQDVYGNVARLLGGQARHLPIGAASTFPFFPPLPRFDVQPSG